MTSSRRPRPGSGDGDGVGELDERLDAALITLAADAQQVPSGVLARQKESLVTAIHSPTPVEAPAPDVSPAGRRAAPSRRRRFFLAGGAAALGATLLVAGPAAAGQVMAWLGRAPTTTEEADRMQMIYQGDALTWNQIQKLQAQGKAMVMVHDSVSQSKGQIHVFDTEAQAEAWACVHVPGRSDSPACHASSVPTVKAPDRP